MILTTERLVLRQCDNDDARCLYEYIKDPNIGPLVGWPPVDSKDYGIDYFEKVLKKEPEFYAIHKMEDDSVTGCIGLYTDGAADTAGQSRECQMVFWLGSAYWGKGYAAEAAKKLTEHAFTVLKMDVIWCKYFDGNERSRRVQEKCGFTHYRTGIYLSVSEERTYTVHTSVLTKKQWLEDH